jgi:dolichyl-phosphate beta-glucosyltransferase
MSKQIRPYLSIVIPAFSEARRLPATLEAVRAYVRTAGHATEVLAVIEPSPDNTLKVAEAARLSFPELRVIANDRHRGKGFAVRTGMLAARGQFTFFTDADLSTPLSHVAAALQIFRDQRSVDVVVGNRQHPKSQILQRQNVVRETMGKTFNQLVRLLAGLEISDTQCGFKGFRQAAAREIFGRQRMDGFSFDVEVLLLARHLHFKVVDMPVEWSNSTESKVHVLRDSLRMLRDVVAVRALVQKTVREYPQTVGG